MSLLKRRGVRVFANTLILLRGRVLVRRGGGEVSVVRFAILMFNLLIYNSSTLIVSRDVRINSQVQL